MTKKGEKGKEEVQEAVVASDAPTKADEQPESVFAFLLRTSGKRFHDISSEVEREYTFPGGEKYTIASPIALHVSKSGGHRILDLTGRSHYVQPKEGWSLTWTVQPGHPFFLNI